MLYPLNQSHTCILYTILDAFTTPSDHSGIRGHESNKQSSDKTYAR